MDFKITKILFLLLFLFGKMNAQTPFQIHGVVLNSQTKEPLSNVNVSIKSNSSEGSTTNQNGFFQIEIFKRPTTLSFSFIGFETEVLEIKNADNREFVIELEPTASALPEISVSSKRKVDTIFYEPFSVVDYYSFYYFHSYKSSLFKLVSQPLV